MEMGCGNGIQNLGVETLDLSLFCHILSQTATICDHPDDNVIFHYSNTHFPLRQHVHLLS